MRSVGLNKENLCYKIESEGRDKKKQVSMLPRALKSEFILIAGFTGTNVQPYL